MGAVCTRDIGANISPDLALGESTLQLFENSSIGHSYARMFQQNYDCKVLVLPMSSAYVSLHKTKKIQGLLL